MSDTNSNSFRAEARPLDYNDLSESQQDAATKIAKFLISAKASSSDSNRAPRANVILVSGGKGSGKTTLVLSLLNWCEEQKKQGSITNQSSTGPEPSSEITSYIKSHSEIHWLETLSLDGLPRGTNLTASIFARISHHAGRNADRDQGLRTAGILEPVSVADRALHALGSLRSDAVMAFEGNLKDRLGAMDPESYAIATIENEKKRLEAASRLADVLDRLISSRNSNEPGIYVVPIDDLDSSPERAAEVMRLTQSLSCKRLVFVLLGSVDILDKVLFYDVKARFLANNTGLDEDGRDALIAAANEISSATLRKIAPPSQRVFLDSISLTGAANFKPDGKDQSLYKFLQLVTADGPLLAPKNNQGAGAVDTYSILLARDPFSEIPNGAQFKLDQRACFYDGSGLLRSPPRQLADLYELMKERATESGSYQNESPTLLDTKLIQGLFKKIFTPIVDEDGALTPPVQERLKVCLETDPLHRAAGA